MPRDLKNSVVVVAGASSGIGRASAQAFAAAEASVVLAARREEPLRDAAAECERHGGRALAVPTDVRDAAAVHCLAEQGENQFGGIDVWVNNAGVTLLGRFEDAPEDLWREVVEVNLFGYVNSVRAALPELRRRGSGIIINVGSVDSRVGAPYGSAYVASKFAVRGFSECLRDELRSEAIDVRTIMPSSIDTPLFQHAANLRDERSSRCDRSFDRSALPLSAGGQAPAGRDRRRAVRPATQRYTTSPCRCSSA